MSSQSFLNPPIFSPTSSLRKPKTSSVPNEQFWRQHSAPSWTSIPSSPDMISSSETSFKSSKGSDCKPSVGVSVVFLEPDLDRGIRRERPKRASRSDDRVLAFAVTITLALLVIIGVPLGAILPQKYVLQLPMNVLVPFYVDPEPGAWDRLYEAAIKNDKINFTVILNPDDGPGPAAWPSALYIDAIKKLNKFLNVQTVGYIDTQSGLRDNETIRTQIDTYAGWNNISIPLHGIFFDHAPTFDFNNTRSYMRNISETVRHSDGFTGPPVLLYNTGVVPNANLSSIYVRPDTIVVLESSYMDRPKHGGVAAGLRALNGTRANYAYLMHSIPSNVGRTGLRRVMNSLRRNVEWLFLSNLTGEGKYENYSNIWEEFLDVLW